MKHNSLRFPLPIWKLIYDQSTSEWFVVCKNPETKLTEIHSLSGQKSKLSFTTTFWSGISECNYGKLVIHSFLAPDRPEPMGIEVFDGKTGLLIWKRPELIFQHFIDREKLLAILKNNETFQYHILNSSSGETMEIHEQNLDLSSFYAPDLNESNLSQVSIYREGEENFALIKQFINEKDGKTIAGLVEYQETESLIVISYYIRASNGFVNECCIFDLSGKILAKETLALKSDQLALNTFMIQGQTVVMIKERKEVIFYEQ